MTKTRPDPAVEIQGGPGDDGAGVISSGKINFDAGEDGLASIVLNGPSGLSAIWVDGSGVAHQQAISYIWSPAGSGGTLYGVSTNFPNAANPVFSISVDANGNYTFTQKAPLVHPATNDGNAGNGLEIEWEDNLTLPFGFTITDRDGDTATGQIAINVDDDTPILQLRPLRLSSTMRRRTSASPAMRRWATRRGPTLPLSAAPCRSRPVRTVLARSRSQNPCLSPTAPTVCRLRSRSFMSIRSRSRRRSSRSRSTGCRVAMAARCTATAQAIPTARNPAFTLTVNGSGGYTFTAFAPLNHPFIDEDSNNLPGGTEWEDELTLAFTYTAKDGDGDATTNTLTITVDDDTPDAANDVASVEEGGGNAVNLVIVLDVSASMNSNPNVPTYATRLELAKDALTNLINAGNVNSVFLVTFDGEGQFINSGANGGWFTPGDAIAAINLLSTGSGTDYDAALEVLDTNLVPPPSGGTQTIMYFVSDGEPNQNNGTGSNGIDPTEEAAFDAFLLANNISQSIAVGVGSNVNATNLKSACLVGGGDHRR